MQKHQNGLSGGKPSGSGTNRYQGTQRNTNYGASKGSDRNGANERNIYPIGYKVVEDLCKRLDNKELLPGSTDLIRKVTSLSFKKRMDELWEQQDTSANFLKVIVKAISRSQSELTVMTTEFIDDVLESTLLKSVIEKHAVKCFLKSNISEEMENLLNQFVQLMTSILSRMPHVVNKFIPHIASLKLYCGQCKEGFNPELKENFGTLIDLTDRLMVEKSKIANAKEAKPRFRTPNDAEGPPPNDFREISVCPTKEDMLLTGKPFLRKNISQGRYDSSNHYLDVQFRLLREDLLDPLRAGVRDYSSAVGKNKKHGDVFVYQNVRIELPQLQYMIGEMVCSVTFRRRKCSWIRQMKGGSVVVLSKDGFQQDFVFGTIQNREVKDLDNGRVTLLFENLKLLDHAATYKMIESSAYYEAYKHVLLGLQSFHVCEQIPFHRYLVEVNTSPRVPSYLARNSSEIDLGVICGSPTPVDVRNAHEQIEPWEINLDESQHRALTMALRQEMVVIQGPPGTGKTHVGHQIARVLLANQNLWNWDNEHPMLVVCYTNHALDQFLNGILKCMEIDAEYDGYDEDDGDFREQLPLIRVGSRSKDENLAKYNLNELRRTIKGKVPKDLVVRRAQTRECRENVMWHIEKAYRILNKCKSENEVLSELLLYNVGAETVIAAKHVHQLKACVIADKLHLNDVMIEWLTRTNRPILNKTWIQMDYHLIHQLIQEGYPELLAKNLTFLCKNNYEEIGPFFRMNAENIYQWINDPLPEVIRWPSVNDMTTLIETFGIREQEAYEALTVNGNVEKAAETIARSIEQNVTMQFERMEVKDVKPQAEQINGLDDEDKNSELDLLDEYERERAEAMDVNLDDDFDFAPAQQQCPGSAFQAEPVEALEGNLTAENGWQTVGKTEHEKRSLRLDDYKERILGAEPCTKEEAHKVDDIWQLPVQDRWRLHKYWTNNFYENYQTVLSSWENEYRRLTRKMNEIKQLIDVELLRSARVLGMTTTGAAKLQPVLKTINCPIVIIEEAAEVLEAHIVTALTVNCKHLILIGDHKQLRPNPAVYTLAKNFNLDISLFERLINNKFPYTMLQNQHRMRTEIARALMPHFYDDLHDDPSVLQYESIAGMGKNFLFINHAHPEKDNRDQDQRSHMNEFEGEYSVQLARYLLQQGYRADKVTILSTYMEQMIFIRKRAQAVLGAEHQVKIEVVDNYQGEESDIVILSFVRSLNAERKIGFLNVANRVCVALSRAKMGLYCVGNIDFLAQNSDLWENIKASLVEHNALSSSLEIVCQRHGSSQIINTWEDFQTKSANGGCQLACTDRLDCGHACTQLCHPTPHSTVICTKDCERSCPNGHPCNKQCSIPCGDCTIAVQATLPCGHTADKPCHEELETVKCPESCPLKLACGHNCVEKCSQPCAVHCHEMIAKQLPCVHSMLMRCCEDPASARCVTKVEKEWSGCGHRVIVDCHIDPTVAGCPHPCAQTLPGCEHKCTGTCGGCRRGRLHVRCEEKCERVLICGHVCESNCSTTCPPCEKPCETSCSHSKCSTNFISAHQSQKCRPMIGYGKKVKGRTCGQLCSPCLEPCANRCVHYEIQEPCVQPCDDREHCRLIERACDRKCAQQCNVGPCNERCEKLLDCGHRCLGLCGEDCPDLCGQCPEGSPMRAKYDESSENENNELFVKLTCGHCVELERMDGWVKALLDGPSAAVQITCPTCNLPIQKSRRYQRELTQCALDMETVKRKIIAGTPGQLEAERKRILYSLDIMINGRTRHTPEQQKWLTTAEALKEAMSKTKKEHLTNVMIASYANAVEFMRSFDALLEEIQMVKHRNNLNVKINAAARLFFGPLDIEPKLILEWTDLLDLLKKHLIDKSASVSMQEQFKNELTRLRRIVELGKLLLLNGEISERAEEAIIDIDLLLNRSVASDDQSLENFTRLMKIVNSGFDMSYYERMDIRKALSAVNTAWRRCPNGHMYEIGECNVDIDHATCPECNAQ